MFKSLTRIPTLAGLAMLATLSFAHAADMAPVAAATPAAKPAKMPHDTACKPVMDACKAAGFSRGMHKDGKGLIADCIKPLEDGKSVAGVTLDKTQIDACKTAHAARKAQYDAKMKNDPAFAQKVTARKAARANKMSQPATAAGATALPAAVAPAK